MKIPIPKTGSWKKTHGCWKEFVKAIQKSIGKNLGSGIIKQKKI